MLRTVDRVIAFALMTTSAMALSTLSGWAQTSFPSPTGPERTFTLTPPLHLQEAGTIAAGAQILKGPGTDGGEFHYDYLQADYQKPLGANKNSLIMWHGCLGAAWERRPDGRGPGFMALMVQRKWPVYVLDQPRISRGQRGLGAYGPFPAITNPGACGSYETFRYGSWVPPSPRQFFPGVQLAQDPKSVAALCQLSGSPGGPGFPFSNVDPLSQTEPPSNVQVVAVDDLLKRRHRMAS